MPLTPRLENLESIFHRFKKFLHRHATKIAVCRGIFQKFSLRYTTAHENAVSAKNEKFFQIHFLSHPPVGLFEAQMTKKRLNFINCLHFLINKPRKRCYFALETKNFPSTMQWTWECRLGKNRKNFSNIFSSLTDKPRKMPFDGVQLIDSSCNTPLHTRTAFWRKLQKKFMVLTGRSRKRHL